MASAWRPAKEWQPTDDELAHWARTSDAQLSDQDEDLLLVALDGFPDVVIPLANDPSSAQAQAQVLADALRLWARDGVLRRFSGGEPTDGTDLASELRSIANRLDATPHPAVAAAARYLRQLADLVVHGVRDAEDVAPTAVSLAGFEIELSWTIVPPRTGTVWWALGPARQGMRHRFAFDLSTGRIWTRYGAASSAPTDNAPIWASDV